MLQAPSDSNSIVKQASHTHVCFLECIFYRLELPYDWSKRSCSLFLVRISHTDPLQYLFLLMQYKARILQVLKAYFEGQGLVNLINLSSVLMLVKEFKWLINFISSYLLPSTSRIHPTTLNFLFYKSICKIVISLLVHHLIEIVR